jgi:hypothetical protein
MGGLRHDPFDLTHHFGIDSEQAFIPFDTTGTVVYFQLRTPTEWEKTHLPVLLLTSNVWNPTEEVLRPGKQSCESIEMRTIHSLMSGITRRQINTTKRDPMIEWHRVSEIELGKISSVNNSREFCERLISAVNIATAYCDDIDQWDNERRISSIISND